MKAIDIIFWILILIIVGIAVWKLFGSPTDTATLIAVTLFIAGSEILLWKALFSIDKKTSCGFLKIKNEINNKFSKIDNKLDNLINKINEDSNNK